MFLYVTISGKNLLFNSEVIVIEILNA